MLVGLGGWGNYLGLLWDLFGFWLGMSLELTGLLFVLGFDTSASGWVIWLGRSLVFSCFLQFFRGVSETLCWASMFDYVS